MTTRCGPRRRRLSSSARASAARGARCARGAEPRLGTLRSPVSRARSHRTTIRREIGDLLFVIPRLRLHLGRVQHALELQQRRHREEQHGKGKHEDVHLIVRVRVEVRPQERASATTDEVFVVDGDEGERAPHDRERAARGRLPRTRANGDAVEIRYRVMRLGTKARDGLTGEGQTIFSFGYGEDDDKEGDKLPVQLSGRNLVAGVNDALVGMQPGGKRRVLVRPERGWRELTGACAVGEKEIGLDAAKRVDSQDGNLVFRADIGAAIENETACQNKESQPQPRSYGAKARFGRRFDESLLVELDLVGFSDATTVAKSGGSVDTSSAAFRCKQNPFAEGCDDGVPVAPPPPPPPAPLAAAE